MIRRPDTPNTLVKTPNRLPVALQFLPTSLPEQGGLLAYLLRLEIPHTDRLLSPVDVLALDNRVFLRSRGYADFNLGVCSGERWEVVLDVGTKENPVNIMCVIPLCDTYTMPLELPAQSQ